MKTSDTSGPLSPDVPDETERIVRGSPVIDFLFIAAALALGNWLIAPGDWGWRSLNPTPFLLLPILLGGRYGIGWGLATGLLTSAGLLVLHSVPSIDFTSLETLFLRVPFYYLSLPFTGALCGLLDRYVRHKNRRLAQDNRQLHDGRSAQQTNLEAAYESSHLLREELAQSHTELNSLDRELRRLATPASGPLFDNALELIADLYGVYEAAIYRIEGGSHLVRAAFIGSETPFPEVLPRDDCPLVRAALHAGRMATPREVWDETPRRGTHDYLAAIPWVAGGSPPSAILVLRSLPFLNLTWRNLAGIDLICRWAARFVALHGDPATHEAPSDPILSHPEFKRGLALAIDTVNRFHLPSSIAVIRSNGAPPPATREQLEERVRPILQGAEVATRLPGDIPGLAVLLPMAGRIDSEDFADRFAATLNPETGETSHDSPSVSSLLLAEKRELEHVWKEIEEHGKP